MSSYPHTLAIRFLRTTCTAISNNCTITPLRPIREQLLSPILLQPFRYSRYSISRVSLMQEHHRLTRYFPEDTGSPSQRAMTAINFAVRSLRSARDLSQSGSLWNRVTERWKPLSKWTEEGHGLKAEVSQKTCHWWRCFFPSCGKAASGRRKMNRSRPFSISRNEKRWHSPLADCRVAIHNLRRCNGVQSCGDAGPHESLTDLSGSISSAISVRSGAFRGKSVSASFQRWSLEHTEDQLS